MFQKLPRQQRRGASLSEYVVLMGLISILCIGVVYSLGASVKDIYTGVFDVAVVEINDPVVVIGGGSTENTIGTSSTPTIHENTIVGDLMIGFFTHRSAQRASGMDTYPHPKGGRWRGRPMALGLHQEI